MQRVNGLLSIIGEIEEARIRRALKVLQPRAWKGLAYWHDGSWGREPSRRRSPLLACCLMSDELSGVPLHGSLYPQEDLERLFLNGELEGLSHILRCTDGHYALALPIEDGVLVARDPLGAKPLFHSSSLHCSAVASDPNALRCLGLTLIRRIPPGALAILRVDGPSLVMNFRDTLLSHSSITSMEEAIEELLKTLELSLARRLCGVKRLALAFSGGLDSSLLALLASKRTRVLCVSVCAPNSLEEARAKMAASLLGLELLTVKVSAEEAYQYVKTVRELTDRGSLMDLAIGLAFYLAAQRAKEEGCDAIALGQLADELFGGYAKYLKLYERGEVWAKEAMQEDVLEAHYKNLERDEASISPHLELLLPYGSLEMVRLGLSLPLTFKLDPKTGLRKLVLRSAALKAGLPRELAEAPKKALQYGSGLQRLLRATKIYKEL